MTSIQKNKQKKNLRVLQVLPALQVGGVERGTLDLAVYLKKRNIFSIVVSSGGILTSTLKRYDIPHISLEMQTKNPFKIYSNIRKLQKVIKDFDISLVHARSRAPAWSAFFAAKKLGVPFITTFHGFYKFKGVFKKIYNGVMSKGARVIAVSNLVKDHLKKYYHLSEEKISVVHRGVDLEIFDPKKVAQSRISALLERYNLPYDKHILLLPSRLSRGKGHTLIIEALSKIKGGEVALVFVGCNPSNLEYQKELMKQASYFGVSEIYMIDNCQDMPALYSLASLVIIPSIVPETFGRVIAEAGAMGKISIASAIGGALEIVKDKETGFLFQSANPGDLAKTLERALRLSKKARKEMEEAARKCIEQNFSLEKMCSKTLKVYQDILAEE